MCVNCNNEQGTYLSTRYLIAHGHTNIAFVADYRTSTLLTERYKGYCKALEEHHIPVREELVFELPPNYEWGKKAGKEIALSPHKITGVVTTADICAIGIMEGARQSGMRIPADLSIIGFDDILPCLYTTPKLTTISQHLRTKAKCAADLILEKLSSGTVAQNKIMIDVDLVERNSVVDLL